MKILKQTRILHRKNRQHHQKNQSKAPGDLQRQRDHQNPSVLRQWLHHHNMLDKSRLQVVIKTPLVFLSVPVNSFFYFIFASFFDPEILFFNYFKPAENGELKEKCKVVNIDVIRQFPRLFFFLSTLENVNKLENKKKKVA